MHMYIYLGISMGAGHPSNIHFFFFFGSPCQYIVELFCYLCFAKNESPFLQEPCTEASTQWVIMLPAFGV